MKITIIGNMSFLKKFEEAKEILQQRGYEVIIPEKSLDARTNILVSKKKSDGKI